MTSPRVWLGLSVLLLLLSSAPSLAQYMYLDSNGDGVNTAADVVNAVGPTTIDIWLVTDHNRDGSSATCAIAPGEPMTLNSYSVALRASGGTMEWGQFTSQLVGSTIHFFHGSTSTDYWDGYGGATYNPPGTYRLATLIVSVASGSPSIDFIPKEPGSFVETDFGSQCAGLDLDNTLKLGQDWSDHDGLAFGPGGTPNMGPTLAQPADMTLTIGESMAQALTASDADGQGLDFSKVSGPAYVSVGTLAPGTGTGSGEVYAAPRLGDAGNASASVAVTDGIAADAKSFAISVASGANHPPSLARIRNLVVPAGAVSLTPLSGADTDGQSLQFSLVSGPAFAAVTTARSGAGGGAGVLRLTPGLCDLGSASLRVSVTDGIGAIQETFMAEVVSAGPAPSNPVRSFPIPAFSLSVGLGDLNGDSRLDVVTLSNEPPGKLAILIGLPDGTFSPGITMSGISGSTWPASLALGDVNGDGHLDVIATNQANDILNVLLGNGDGTFQPVVALPTGHSPTGLVISDVNSDGKPDLVNTDQGSGTVSVHLGAGNGAFAISRMTPMGESPVGLAAYDFNLDGNVDLAVANSKERSLSIFLGRGNGFFEPQIQIPLGGDAVYVAAGDLNNDGAGDLAVASFLRGRVHVLAGNGDGSFGAPADIVLPIGTFSTALLIEDLNLDGRPDLVIAGGYILVAYGNGDMTFGTLQPLPIYGEGLAVGRVDQDGFPDIMTTDETHAVHLWLNQNGSTAAEARVFLDGMRTLPGLAGPPVLGIRVEPIGGTYQNSSLDLTSFTLSSDGTGSVAQISSVSPRTVVEGDTDKNGIAEMPATFARQDLARLFDQVHGRQTITADLQGALLDGRRFCSAVSLTIVGTGGPLAASVWPNPLNPEAKLRFSTSQVGFVRVRMYDLQGRVVRTLLDQQKLDSGDHELRIDGRGGNGEKLASGVYFYEVAASEGSVRGRLTILK